MEIEQPHKPTDIRWTNPVQMDLSTGRRVSVAGPAQALVFLNQNWPTSFDLRRDAAKSKCISALSGRQSAEEARKAFVDAAFGAGLITAIA